MRAAKQNLRTFAVRVLRKALPLTYHRRQYAAALRAALSDLRRPPARPPLALAAAPDLGTIELNTACNLRCRICNSFGKTRGNGVMSPATLEQVLQRLRGSGRREVSLHTIGEPLLYPHLADALALLRRHGFTVPRFSSNGQLLDQHADLLLEYADVIRTLRLSVDGMGAQYEEQRQGGSFTRLTAGLRQFHMRNRARRAGRIALRIDSVLLRDNLPQTREFLDYFRQFCPLDNIHFHVAHTFGAVHGYIAEHGLLRGRMVKSAPCPTVGIGAVIQHNGNLSLCSHDYHGDLVIGNFLTDELPVLWGGVRHRALLAEHLERGACGCPSCAGCAMVDARYARLLELAVPYLYCRHRHNPERYAEALRRCVGELEENDDAGIAASITALLA